MPLVVIPARKGKSYSWSPKKEWKKEDEFIPKELDRAMISNIIFALANAEMAIQERDYSKAYYPFYQSAVSHRAFDYVVKEGYLTAEGVKSPEWEWIKQNYDTPDVYLIFTRLMKSDLEVGE